MVVAANEMTGTPGFQVGVRGVQRNLVPLRSVSLGEIALGRKWECIERFRPRLLF